MAQVIQYQDLKTYARAKELMERLERAQQGDQIDVQEAAEIVLEVMSMRINHSLDDFGQQLNKAADDFKKLIAENSKRDE